MAHSLTADCTPLKIEYDSCFNSWFEGYLEPAVSAAASPEQRAKYSKEKAEEYERKCGKIWASYRDCVQKAVKEKGLNELLDQARKENPLKEQPAISSPSQSSSS
ncbi:hypothetical protein BV25DRAFT_1222118 [Artomyces pyxidatus]|uniref:Uncharacterized protein n=1 Tax=Artomyces pyxidatus TaxID=48021 RepID=A0ACB8SQ76_9AGAM|nr:hypothetical protein BV25DRAFT_1222118 [Artomyces pyxidatus]